MKKSIKNFSFWFILIVSALCGSLLGGVMVYAHEAGPYYLSPSWNYIYPVHTNAPYYSFTQYASLLSDDYDSIYAWELRQYNAYSPSPYNAYYGWGYLYSDYTGTRVVQEFGGQYVNGYDRTVQIYQWFEMPPGGLLAFELYVFWDEGLDTGRQIESWIATP